MDNFFFKKKIETLKSKELKRDAKISKSLNPNMTTNYKTNMVNLVHKYFNNYSFLRMQNLITSENKDLSDTIKILPKIKFEIQNLPETNKKYFNKSREIITPFPTEPKDKFSLIKSKKFQQRKGISNKNQDLRESPQAKFEILKEDVKLKINKSFTKISSEMMDLFKLEENLKVNSRPQSISHLFYTCKTNKKKTFIRKATTPLKLSELRKNDKKKNLNVLLTTKSKIIRDSPKMKKLHNFKTQILRQKYFSKDIKDSLLNPNYEGLLLKSLCNEKIMNKNPVHFKEKALYRKINDKVQLFKKEVDKNSDNVKNIIKNLTKLQKENDNFIIHSGKLIKLEKFKKN